MADVSPEVVARQLESHERRTDAIHQELGQRITQVARDMVPLAVWQQAQQTWSDTVKRMEREHDAEIQRVEREHARDNEALRHSGRAALALATAASTSAASARSTSPLCSPVAGL